MQEVFIRLLQLRVGWRMSAKFTTWLYKVTLNVCRELMRKRRPDSESYSPAAQVDDPERGVVLSQLTGALQRLPERQREVVVLRMLEGLSTKETAKVIGCRQGTVKVHLIGRIL